jgi:hypothetical protein
VRGETLTSQVRHDAGFVATPKRKRPAVHPGGASLWASGGAASACGQLTRGAEFSFRRRAVGFDQCTLGGATFGRKRSDFDPATSRIDSNVARIRRQRSQTTQFRRREERLYASEHRRYWTIKSSCHATRDLSRGPLLGVSMRRLASRLNSGAPQRHGSAPTDLEPAAVDAVSDRRGVRNKTAAESPGGRCAFANWRNLNLDVSARSAEGPP